MKGICIFLSFLYIPIVGKSQKVRGNPSTVAIRSSINESCISIQSDGPSGTFYTTTDLHLLLEIIGLHRKVFEILHFVSLEMMLIFYNIIISPFFDQIKIKINRYLSWSLNLQCSLDLQQSFFSNYMKGSVIFDFKLRREKL